MIGIVAGLLIMIGSEAATLAGIEPFASWNTPICWTGFILFADAFVFRARGGSWIRSSPREFVALALASIPLWLVFEWFNLSLRNWHYIGLPEDPVVRNLGYAWAFATIWPAIFEGAELVGALRRSDVAMSTSTASPAPLAPALTVLSITAGVVMLASPFIAPSYAQYLAAPVWLGFILMLDPINARLGAESLLRDAQRGDYRRVVNLVASGLLCGFLWEFWNYWAHTKWIYTVPILENIKIFEMPALGYFGFPAFALECFTMYVLIRRAFTRRGRPIAL
jgi:hypothetical protein